MFGLIDILYLLATVFMLILFSFFLTNILDPTNSIPKQIISGKTTNSLNLFLLDYLKTPITTDINSDSSKEKLTIADIISMVDIEDGKEERIKAFQEKSKEIIEANYPLTPEGWKGVNAWWLRVYDESESISQSKDGKYFSTLGGDLNAGKGYIYGPGSNCNPNNPKDSTVSIITIPKTNGGNVKVVFCVINSYFKYLDENE